MLANIKSTFFIKILFSQLDEENKLKMAKYNKKLQKQIDLSFINYKIFSKRYIIYESDENVKECNIDDSKLIFEGKYLNGRRNGEGKEFGINGKVIFEGEYI